ncbi:MAG: type II toxin-antitoxin system PemK/MazF family toxin [Stellaceae bacterium]
MPRFEPWDVIKIPLPDGSGPPVEHRPALVIAAGRRDAEHELVWALMITSAANAPWPGDVPISDLRGAGLPAPSIVRCAKIATFESGRAQKIGVLTRPAERAAIARHLALAVAPATGRQSNN